MDGLIDATLALLTDPFGLFLFGGTLVAGLVSGIVPGMGTMALAVIVLPFTVALPLPHTMVMYGTLFISGVAGCWLANCDTEPRIPSTGPQYAGASRVVLGGVIAAMLTILLTEGIAGYVFFGFKAPEMFALAFCALAAVAGIASRHGPKGWLALFLGLLVGMSIVGPIAEEPRYAFGSLDILGSISFIPLLIGIVVLPGVIDVGSHKNTIANGPSANGLSASRAILPAAVTNAALLPLVALGLPLSIGTVVMIAAAGMQGIEFGPLFIIEAEEAAWALLASALWAGALAPLLGTVTLRRLRVVQGIPRPVVGASLLVIAVASAYTLEGQMRDVYTLFACGIAGYLLRQQGYPLSIVILGIVLAQIVEPAFANAVSLLDGGVIDIFGRPVSTGLIGCGLFAMALGALWKGGPSAAAADEESDNDEGK